MTIARIRELLQSDPSNDVHDLCVALLESWHDAYRYCADDRNFPDKLFDFFLETEDMIGFPERMLVEAGVVWEDKHRPYKGVYAFKLTDDGKWLMSREWRWIGDGE